MNYRRFFKLLLLCWVTIPFACSPDDPSSDDQERGFDQAYFQELNTHDEYDYDRAFDVQSQDQETGNNAFWQIIAKIFSGIAWFFNSVLGYLIIASLIGLLIWIVVKNSSRIFEKNQLNEDEKLVEVRPVEVEDQDYQKLINAALKKQDYRLAIRFGFLSILKYLHTKELIEWKIDKTNLEYQLELPSKHQDTFSSICLIYERIWYGEFTADKNNFNRMTQAFRDMKTTENS